MKLKKRILAVVAAMLMVSAAGCGGSQMDAAEIEALLAQAKETMSSVESMAADMTMEMDMDMNGEVLETTTKANIRTQQNPLKMQMDLSVLMSDGTELNQMQMYAVEQDGHLCSYMSSADVWYAETLELGELDQYNAEENMDLYLDNITSCKAEGKEDIHGTSAMKISGIITGDAMEEVLTNSGLESSASSLGISDEMLAEVYAELKDLPVTLWIDDTGYVVQYALDMTEMMQKIMDASLETMGAGDSALSLKVAQMMISMRCYDFNAVEEIEIPAEALNVPMGEHSHAE